MCLFFVCDEQVAYLKEQDAYLRKKLVKTWLTKGSFIFLLERSFIQRPETKRASKVFRMKFLIHGRYATAIDRHLTARA